ncbi:MAG: acetate--CoA ligase, partial [Chitinophagia bacterium]|nr:acetate--CoA ligase [Chitinophagia bacterium]
MAYPYQITTEAQYHEAYQQSVNDPEAFWGHVASHFTWQQPWDKVLEWNFTDPSIQWFRGGKMNICENAIDRHLPEMAYKPAFIWEPNDPEEHHRIITYRDLHHKVVQFANVLKNNGVKKGDRVCIYMGMVPELAIAVLACARIGAIHSVIFGGFSAQSIADRLIDAQATFIVTSDGAYRGNKEIPLKSVIDDALVQCPFVNKVVVLTRTRTPVSMIKNRDLWWEDEIRKVETMGNPDCPPEPMDAEDPLFILYTSGSTGKPKGVVHTCGGYMVYTTYSFVNVFQYQPGEVHFCTADIGWITGHSYVVYGLLSHGATVVLYEGAPLHPHPGRFWEIIDKHKVSILYTAPTAIRTFMRAGIEYPRKYQLSSLRLLGSVGEPINPEAWIWYHKEVGRERCPIVDTWWQTETGCILISPLPGVTPTKPGSATKPFPGIVADVVNEEGKSCSANEGGYLVIKHPWPSMLRGIHKNPERFKESYWTKFPGMYFTGDSAHRDDRGYFWIKGRVDDVINVSGHRLGTMEVESAL